MIALRRAVRSVLKAPFFTLATVCSLGVGIGACTALFSVVRAVYLTPSPYEEPDRLVEIWATPEPSSRQRIDAIPSARLELWLDRDFRTLEGLSARATTGLVLGGDSPQRVSGEVVSSTFFQTLGIPALIGRTLTRGDDDPAAEAVVVISEPLWEERFLGDPDIVGRSIPLSGQAHTVVGVIPRGFEPHLHAWVPAGPRLARGFAAAWFPVGRIREGSSLEDVRLELQVLATAEVASDSVLVAGMGAVAIPLGATEESMSAGPLWILGALVVAIYLLALTNLSTLFLLRAEERGRMAAVRASLGGSAWQLGRGLLLESLCVAGAGCALALVVSIWGRELMRAGIADQTVFAAGPLIDVPAFAFAAALAMMAAALVGLEPLRHLRRLDLVSLLGRGGTVTTLSVGQRRARGAFVALQVAITIVLVCVGGVLAKAHARIVALDLGYDTERLVAAFPDYAIADMNEPEQWDLAAAVSERLRNVPGVESVATSRRVGQSYPPRPEITAVFEGGTTDYHVRFGLYSYSDVSLDYLRTLGISLLAGRDFGPTDGPGSPPVGIVSVSGARAWWPGEDPIGRRLRLGERGEWITVVGVAEDAALPIQVGRAFSIGMINRGHRPLPHLYRPQAQASPIPAGWAASRRSDPGSLDEVVVMARVSGDAAPVTAALVGEYAALAPRLPLRYAGPLMDWQLSFRSMATLRGYRSLIAALATLGLLIALTGIAAIAVDATTRRARELGIRRALGARPSDIAATVTTEGLVSATLGIVLGSVGIYVLDSMLRLSVYYWDLLAGVAIADARVVGAAILGTLAAVCVAALVGSRRANRIDPAEALRSE